VNCEHTRGLLNAYLDGQLAPARRAQVAEHLRECAGCARALAALEGVNRAIGALDGMAVPDGFSQRVRQAAESARVLGLESAQRRVHLFGNVLTRVAAVVMAAAGLAVGMAMGGTLAGSNGYAAVSDAAESEVLALQTDVLSAVPEGSVSDVYLAFVSESE